MKRIARQRRRFRLLRWMFRRGNRLITCGLDRDGRRPAYTLSLAPHWDLHQTASETFDNGIAAFHRHAELAEQLRGQGWRLASYSIG